MKMRGGSRHGIGLVRAMALVLSLHAFLPTGNALGSSYFIDVKAFGAQGDGFNDDTAAIQSAINSLSAAPSGGIAVFPAGTYLISSSIQILISGVTLCGVAGASVIHQTTSAPLIVVGQFQVQVTIQDLVLESTVPVPTAIEIDFGTTNPVKRHTLKNIMFRKISGNGIRTVKQDPQGSWRDIRVSDCQFDLSGSQHTGILIDGTAGTIPTVNLRVDSTQFIDAGNSNLGIAIIGQLGESFINHCRFDSLDTGVYVTGQVEGLHVTDNSFIQNGRSISIEGSATHLFISDNEFDQIQQYGVWLNNFQGGVGIQGVLIKNSSFFLDFNNAIGVYNSIRAIWGLNLDNCRFVRLSGTNTTAINIAQPSKDVTINSNTIANMSGPSIVVSGNTTRLLITKNIVFNSGGDGIYVSGWVSNFSISGDVIGPTAGVGVNLAGGGSAGSILGENIFQPVGKGINISPATQPSVGIGMNNTNGSGIFFGGATNQGGNL